MVCQGDYFSSVNGHPSSGLNVADRGLAYGDGLFETMRVHAGEVALLERHLKRLSLGCQRLFIPFNEKIIRSHLNGLLDSAKDPTQAVGLYGILKLIVTRGQGGAGYAPPDYEQTDPSVILQLTLKTVDYFSPPSPVSLHLCTQPLSSNVALAGIKHLNRLEYTLAAKELSSQLGKQGLLLDERGCVIETLHHNLFLVKGDLLLTPKLTHCGVAGVMRGLIMEDLVCFLPSMTVREANLTIDDVLQAEEVFLSNSVRGVVGVSSLNQCQWHKHRIAEQLNKQLDSIWSGIDGGR